MTEEKSPSSESILIEAVGGDLRVRGQSGGGFRVESSEPVEVYRDKTASTIRITASNDCALLIAEGADLIIQNVGGDAKVTGLESSRVIIHNVGGDLVVKNAGDTTIGTVGGDMVAKNIIGDLTIEAIGGDASLRGIEGNLIVHTVGSDISLREIEGNCLCENIGSDLLLEIDFSDSQTYRFGVAADIVCRMQPEGSVCFVLPKDVELKSEMIDFSTIEEADTRRINIGNGTPEVTITSANSFTLTSNQGKDYKFDFDFNIGEKINSYVENLHEQIAQNMQNFEGEIARRVEYATRDLVGKAERIRQQAEERTRRQSERQTERAQRHAERHAERLQRQQERIARRFSVSSKTPRSGSVEPVTTQERRMILEMVGTGKLSVEEAERLLRTLDGDGEEKR